MQNSSVSGEGDMCALKSGKQLSVAKNEESPSFPQNLPAETQQSEFFTVGIGASAGGFEALKELFAYVPADIGMAFVVILHFDPKRQSLAEEILARETRMPVREIKGG